MPLKDYFKFLSMNGSDYIDYLVIFMKERPEINNYVNLKKAGKWAKYGDKGYRLLCPLSKEKLENFIIEDLKIDKGDIQIVRTNEFSGYKGF